MRKIFRGMRAAALCMTLMLCAALLCGCTSYVRLSSGRFSADSAELTAVLEQKDIAKLDSFTALRVADFSGSECYEEIMDWAAAHPDIAVRYTVSMPDGSEPDNAAETLDLSGMDEAAMTESLPRLKYLPALKTVSLGEGFSASLAREFTEKYPDINFEGSFTLLGQRRELTDFTLELEGLGHADADAVLDWLPAMKKLQTVELGEEPSEGALEWADIEAFEKACPNAEFHYTFKLYGKSFDLTATELNLSHVPIDDEGALVKQVAMCMPRLQTLDMDSCGVSNEAMAEIRDALPDTNVVWRIWFGEKYSVRTDVERILASNPGLGGELTGENTKALQYCTKVRWLDLGHNSWMSDISFVSSMPELETIIVAMANWSDVSPLADCPKLEYAEIQTSALNDLSPLSGLKNLRHLNIAYCFALHDITPLYELTELERLWIGCYTPIPQAQVEEMQRRAPNCVINTTTVNPTDEGWRYTGWNEYGYMDLDPRYALLRQQFKYEEAPYSYAYYWNDPLYY